MKHAILTFTYLLGAIIAIAQHPTNFYNKDGAAINGYDPVAYFTDHKAAKGKKELMYSWAGTEWYFINKTNLETFKGSPEKFAPQFGGYCAFGVSENHKAPTDPNAFTIVDEKLYLNYNAKVKELWIKDTKGNIAKAEKNWEVLKDQN